MIGYFCKKESIINEVQGLCHKEYYLSSEEAKKESGLMKSITVAG